METNGVTTVKQEPEVKTEETPTEDFQKLTEYGINIKVANEIVKIYETGKLSPEDLDERAMDALKEYNPDDAIAVLKQFCESSLEHVGNKSAFLCGMMKTYRQNKKQGAQASPARGPDPNKLSEILERTGYSLDVTTGQRKYGGPPPGEDDQNPPPPGCEVFCGKIPKDVFEDELIPLFEKCGKIWDLRLMMDPLTQFNRGYCFITFCTKEGAEEATKLDNYAIKPGKNIKVNISVANQRLFVGNIPKSKSKDEIMEEFSKKTEGLVDVIIYRSAEKENQKNRGFAFLEYDSHKSASTAKRKLSTGRLKVWNCDVIVDWADPVDNPDDETMSKVKVLYVRNLTSEVTEDIMKEKFGEFGKIERAKKVKDYGFIHFEDRDDAIKAMQAMNGQKIGKLEIEVSLAKPPSENKKKEQRKREQERQSMMMAMRRGGGPYGGYDDFYAPPMMGPPRGMPRGGGGGGGGGMRPRMPPPPNNFYDDYYDYDYDYYQGGYGGPPPMMRGRRGGGGPPPPMRGRGGGPPPPRGGPRGAGGVARGSRGAIRGARGAPRGRGSAAPPTNGNKSPAMRGGGGAGKRKAGGDMNQGQMKRRNMNDNWGAQPIAQQPLDQAGFGGGGYDSQWYQDSYGQNWG